MYLSIILFLTLLCLSIFCIDFLAENAYLHTQIEDLKIYRNDVSKTFELLNKDLCIINDKLNIKPNDKSENDILINSENIQNDFENIRENDSEIIQINSENQNILNNNVLDELLLSMTRNIITRSN